MTALRTAGPDRYIVAVGLYTDALDATLSRLRVLLGGVWLGTLGLTALLGLLLRKGGRLYETRWFQWFVVAMGPSGIVALLAGWIGPKIAKRLNPLWVKRIAVIGLTLLGLSLVGVF